MTLPKIYNLGSINIDAFYRVPKLVAPGETIKATQVDQHLGGKGINQSVAISKSGGHVIHIGAVGPNSDWVLETIEKFGVPTKHIQIVNETPTGTAIIAVDDAGENTIMLNAGANNAVPTDLIVAAMADAQKDDWLVLQNETNGNDIAVKVAQSKSIRICLSAAPFDKEQVLELVNKVDLIAVNEIEAQEVEAALNVKITDLKKPNFLITKGSKGAIYVSDGAETHCPSFSVEAIDTTGAGDTYLGVFISNISQGKTIKHAMRTASAAAAIQVTRLGAATAIPDINTVQDFLEKAT
jgi:ribokinase